MNSCTNCYIKTVKNHACFFWLLLFFVLQVLFADGSVSFSQDSGPVWVPDSEVQEQNSDQESEDSKKG